MTRTGPHVQAIGTPEHSKGPDRARLPIALAAICLIAGCAPGPRRAAHFKMERPRATSTTEYEIVQEERTSRFAARKQRTDSVSQALDIRTKGWVYHPGLATYSLALRPRYELKMSEAEGESATSNELIFYGYDFSSTLLPMKPYNLTLASSRSQSQFDSELGRATISDTARDSATLRVGYQPLPVSLSVERRQTDREGFFDESRTSHKARGSISHISARSRTFLRSEYDEETREIDGASTSVERLSTNARNSLRVSDAVSLASNVSWASTSSEDTSTETLRASEDLSWRISESLNSSYQASVDHRKTNGAASRNYAGSAGLSHQLYDNLTSSVKAGGGRSESRAGIIDTMRADLDLRYKRRIPGGSLGLTYGYGYSLTDDRTEAVITQVIDEGLALTGTTPRFLTSLRIETGSLVVTHSTGVPVYVEGVDYIVVEQGGNVGIARTPFSPGINDGDTVLVDYRFTADGPIKSSSTRTRAGASLNLWNALSLSYSFSHSKQDFISGILPASLTDETIHNANATFSWRWSKTNGSYTKRESNRTPSTAWTVSERLAFRPARKLSADASVSYSEYTQDDTGNTIRTGAASAGLGWRAASWVDVDARASGERIRGDFQEADNFSVASTLKLRYGLWRGSIRHQYTRQENRIGGQVRNRQALRLQVRREF